MADALPHGAAGGGNANANASGWVRRFAPLIPAQGRVLDLACGQGRHARLLVALGYAVLGVDKDEVALQALRQTPGIAQDRLALQVCDLESAPWPFPLAAFDGIVVTNYLHRPLFSDILASMRPGGVLIYETYAQGNERYGHPRNPAFLLRPDELLEVIPHDWTLVAFEQGLTDEPHRAVRQRVCAIQTTAWPVSLELGGIAD